MRNANAARSAYVNAEQLDGNAGPGAEAVARLSKKACIEPACSGVPLLVTPLFARRSGRLVQPDLPAGHRAEAAKRLPL